MLSWPLLCKNEHAISTEVAVADVKLDEGVALIVVVVVVVVVAVVCDERDFVNIFCPIVHCRGPPL